MTVPASWLVPASGRPAAASGALVWCGEAPEPMAARFAGLWRRQQPERKAGAWLPGHEANDR